MERNSLLIGAVKSQTNSSDTTKSKLSDKAASSSNSGSNKSLLQPQDDQAGKQQMANLVTAEESKEV